jgi:DNA helicase HerA-like ATPase
MFSKAMDVRVKHLTVDHQSAVGLLTFFLLRQALSHFTRIGEAKDQAPVRHVIIIDEAPMVIGSNPKVKHEVIRMLQEVRKFGEGLILVCRNPGIDDDILRETNQKIAHKLDVPKDVSSVASMLGLEAEDKKLLHSLPRGIAFARIGGNSTVLVRVRQEEAYEPTRKGRDTP